MGHLASLLERDRALEDEPPRPAVRQVLSDLVGRMPELRADAYVGMVGARGNAGVCRPRSSMAEPAPLDRLVACSSPIEVTKLEGPITRASFILDRHLRKDGVAMTELTLDEALDRGLPIAFLSYSWDSPAHVAWVHALATRLVSHGVYVVLDEWDTSFGEDLTVFMDKAGDKRFRVLAVITPTYAQKANEVEGGVGYERRILSASVMKDLTSARIIPVLRDNAEADMPAFLGSAKYVDLRAEPYSETEFHRLLRELYGMPATPRPPLGSNPFTGSSDEDAAIALRNSPARYVHPAARGEVSFPYENNSGRYVLGGGDHSFTLNVTGAGPGSVYFYNDPSDIRSVALAPGVTDTPALRDASSYDASSRTRHAQVGDAVVLRNRSGYWAAVFLDEVTTRDTAPDGQPVMRFRYVISPTTSPDFSVLSTDETARTAPPFDDDEDPYTS